MKNRVCATVTYYSLPSSIGTRDQYIASRWCRDASVGAGTYDPGTGACAYHVTHGDIWQGGVTCGMAGYSYANLESRCLGEAVAFC
jgi:hypothetical protein